MASNTTPARTERASLLESIRDGDLTALRDLPFENLAGLVQGDAADIPEELMPMDAAQLGEGFVVVPRSHKKYLVGVPFIILDVDVNLGKKVKGTYFSSVKVKTARPVDSIRPETDTFILNDGGTGIHRQLMDIRQRNGGKFPLPMLCRHGLRVSTYTVTEDEVDGQGNTVFDQTTGKPVQTPVLDPTTNEPVQGETFYLDESL